MRDLAIVSSPCPHPTPWIRAFISSSSGIPSVLGPKKRLHLELEYQRSWHLAILISSAHVYTLFLVPTKTFTSIRHVKHFFYYYQPASQWVYGEEGYLYPQTHNRFQKDQLSQPAPEQSNCSTCRPRTRHKAGRFRFPNIFSISTESNDDNFPRGTKTRSESTFPRPFSGAGGSSHPLLAPRLTVGGSNTYGMSGEPEEPSGILEQRGHGPSLNGSVGQRMDTGQIASAAPGKEQKKRGGFLIFLVYHGVREQTWERGGKRGQNNNTGDELGNSRRARYNTHQAIGQEPNSSRDPPAQLMTHPHHCRYGYSGNLYVVASRDVCYGCIVSNQK